MRITPLRSNKKHLLDVPHLPREQGNAAWARKAPYLHILPFGPDFWRVSVLVNIEAGDPRCRTIAFELEATVLGMRFGGYVEVCVEGMAFCIIALL